MPTYSDLPKGTRKAMKRYLEDGKFPDAFLLAILENNLKGAVAAVESRKHLQIAKIVFWLKVNALDAAWGSPESVQNWMRLGGVNRRA